MHGSSIVTTIMCLGSPISVTSLMIGPMFTNCVYVIIRLCSPTVYCNHFNKLCGMPIVLKLSSPVVKFIRFLFITWCVYKLYAIGDHTVYIRLQVQVS